MGDAMSHAYKEEREWEEAVEFLKEAEDLALEDEEYKNLVDAHIAISVLIRQQAKTCVEIYDKRIEILKSKLSQKYRGDADLSDLDADRERRVLSGWALKDLTK